MRRLIALLLLLGAAGAALVATDAYRFLSQPVALGEAKLVVVPKGAGFTQVVDRLVEEDVFESERYGKYFTAYAMARGVTGRVKSGEYQIEPGWTPATVLAEMVAGRVHQYRLTVVEGWRFADLRRALARHEAIDATLADKPAAAVMKAIDAAGEDPEGRFLPDTYHFPRGTTDVAFLRRAYERMQSALDEIWAERAEDLPLDSAYEALILASIVEKETAVPAERARIAGVFARRLERGMPLQTDPTVIYGIEDFDGNLRRSDLRRDGPYNTYQRTGLPPTPIALPGRAALRAAVNPAEGESLYFVSRGDGTHVFSPTYEEHARAVRKYQKAQ